MFIMLYIVLVASFGIYPVSKDTIAYATKDYAESQDGDLQSFSVEVYEDDSDDKQIDSIPVVRCATKAISKNGYAGRYGYQMLALEEQRYIYERLEQEANAFHYSNRDVIVTSGSSTKIINYQDIKDDTQGKGRYSFYAVMFSVEREIDASVVGEAVVSFLYDHPEYFWSKGYSYFVKSETKKVTKICLQCQEDYYDGQVRADMWKVIDQEIQKYLDLIVGANNDYERELILHDAINEKLTYAYIPGTNKPEEERWAHTVESVFSPSRGSAVCEGYAKAFQLLLNAAGIENAYIVGKANGEGHAWNQVKLGNEWYNVDITWNDTGNKGNHKYFNVPDSNFNNAHKPFLSTAETKVGEWCYKVNTCNATEYSYTKQGTYTPEVSYQVQYEEFPCADLMAFNQGIEVKSGSFVEENTKLEVSVSPKIKDEWIQVTTCIGEEVQYYEGYAKNLSYSFAIKADTKVSVSIAIPITSISINRKQLHFVGYGYREQLVAEALPAETTEKYIWKSVNPGVAIVEEGLVTSVGKGNTVIQAMTLDGRIVAECSVEVVAPSIKIITKKSTIKVGKTIAFKAKVSGLQERVTWTVSNKKRASISAKTGKFKAKKKGVVWVTAKCGNYKVKKKITIKK